jgi:hypothetical protein
MRRGAGRGELGIAFVVIRRERLLEPVRTIRFEGPCALDRGLCVVDEPGVDHELHGITQAAACLANERDIGGLIPAHGIPAEFDGREALVNKPARAVVRFRGGLAPKRASVRNERVAKATA